MSQAILETLLVAENLANTHRLPEAIELLTDQLQSLRPNSPFRATLYLTLARYQIDLPYTRQAARNTLQRLAETHPEEAEVESLWLDYFGALHPDELLQKTRQLLPLIRQSTGPLRARRALSVGKVFTDTYQFESARTWLIYGLICAREDGSQPLLAACAGALAEVFYRIGALRPALELIELDAALLPAGSLHQERLQVYRAHCYRQFGQIDAARGLYHQAFQAAKLRGFGQPYPLRGLIWCDLLDIAKGAESQSTIKRLQATYTQLEDLQEPYSLATASLALATLARLRDQPAKALDYTQRAIELFAEHQFYFEAAWTRGETIEFQQSAPTDGPPTLFIPASDLHLTQVPLVNSGQYWSATQQAFQSSDPTQIATWMGFFF